MYKHSIRSYIFKIINIFSFDFVRLTSNGSTSSSLNESNSDSNGLIEKQLSQKQLLDLDNNNNNNNTNNKKSDANNICFLFFLYLLQGVPLGLTASLPYILSAKKASYGDQGTFSLATWPFSMKLLWAPIVDSIYFKRLGRRKSWLVPIQYLIGVFMLIFANYVHLMLEDENIEIGNGLKFFVILIILKYHFNNNLFK
jgi:hypothetical protein